MKILLIDLIKTIIKLALLSISLHIFQVCAGVDAINELQIRLKKINSFYATFIHIVTNITGDLIQQNEGELWIKRPNQFNWHITSPDESYLISDGNDLWVYNPMIEQVTIISLSKVIANTPFILITRNDPISWQEYQISQNGDEFWIKQIEKNSNLKHFYINLRKDGSIKQIRVTDQDGQTSSYTLLIRRKHHIENDKFKFIIPPGVTVDDQRSLN